MSLWRCQRLAVMSRPPKVKIPLGPGIAAGSFVLELKPGEGRALNILDRLVLSLQSNVTCNGTVVCGGGGGGQKKYINSQKNLVKITKN
jgi:hypothetical protein